MTSTPGQVAGTVLFVAPSRISTLIFASISTILALEAARRAIRFVADQAGYTPQSGLGKRITDWTPDVVDKILTSIQPPKDATEAQAKKGVTHQQLAKAFLITTVIANLGWEFSKWLSGGVISPYYNNVARFVGPLIIDVNYRHPAIQYGLDLAKRAFPSLG